MSLRRMQWARWPLGTFVRMKGMLGTVECEQEQILIEVTSESYVIQKRTKMSGKESVTHQSFCYNEKSIERIGVDYLTVNDKSVTCGIWQIEYTDNRTVEKLWIDESPNGRGKKRKESDSLSAHPLKSVTTQIGSNLSISGQATRTFNHSMMSTLWPTVMADYETQNDTETSKLKVWNCADFPSCQVKLQTLPSASILQVLEAVECGIRNL